MKKIHILLVALVLVCLGIVGATTISDSKSTVDGGLTVSGGTGALNVTGNQLITATGTGNGLWSQGGGNYPLIKAQNTQAGANTNYANLAQNSTNGANYFYRNLAAANTTGPVISAVQDNELDDQVPLKVAGYGDADLSQWYNGTTLSARIMENGSAWFLDSVSATDFVDRTPAFDKDAISAIKNTAYKNGEIDHSKLPAIAQANYEVPNYGQVLVNKTRLNEKNETEVYQEYETQVVSYTTHKGRSLSGMVTVNTEALQELIAKVETLESELCKKDNTYAWCK